MKHLPRKAIPCRALLMLALVVLLVEAEPANIRQSDFVFDGRPIHPLSVQPLVGDLADEQPMIAAVDLDGSAKNSSNEAKVTTDNGMVRSRDGDGFVAYRQIGTTPSGLHVLIVMVNGGGSGVFEDVLWVKLVRDTVWENGQKRDRTALVRLGQFPLGDRDDGEVKLEGSTLLVGKSRYRQRDEIIPLE
jgi:hypothetical protein